MTDTQKTADKQPDQADPQNAPETPGKTDADQRRVLVCLNCGHIWEAKAGTLRPQCFECKRQRVRAATPEETAQFDQGVTKIIPADSGTKPAEPDQQKAGKKQEIRSDQADQDIDHQIDPLKLVDPVRIPKKKSEAAASHSPMFPAVMLLAILGVIAALYFLFARSQHQETPQEYPIEEPAPAPFRFTGATLPGM